MTTQGIHHSATIRRRARRDDERCSKLMLAHAVQSPKVFPGIRATRRLILNVIADRLRKNGIICEVDARDAHLPSWKKLFPVGSVIIEVSYVGIEK